MEVPPVVDAILGKFEAIACRKNNRYSAGLDAGETKKKKKKGGGGEKKKKKKTEGGRR